MAIDEIAFNKWQSKQVDVAIGRAERRFFGHINRMSKELKYLLADVSRIDNMPKAKIDKLIQQAVAIQSTRYEDAIIDFTSDAAKLAEYAATSERLGLAMAVSPKDVATIAQRTPIAANGLLFSEHLDTLVAYNNKRLADTIRKSWAAKDDIGDLSSLIIGTDKLRHADGLMYKQKVAARASIDTAAHHSAMIGKVETWKANDVYKYKIQSALDNRVTELCRSLDQMIFEYGAANARLPPFHYRCRTVIVPVIDDAYKFLSQGRTRSSMYGSTDANITYNEWAAQNADKIAEQNEIDRLKRNRRARARRKADKD